jgi:c-di-GMP-binding flagellar brake protein YcgR
MAADARAHERIRCHFPATADGARGPIRGTCTNLSVGGLFLEGVQLPVGSTTLVTVEHPSLGRFQAAAEVRHHVVVPKGMGVSFMRIDPAQLEVLQRMIATLPR